MVATPLSEMLFAPGQAETKLGEYCGAQSLSSFGDTAGEFHALVHGCAVYDRGWRGHFRIRGSDRKRWLNGMVSNNARDLPAGQGNYNFLLSAQGRIQGDLYVYNCGEDFLATTEMSQLEGVLKLLRKYIIMDKVDLVDISREITAIGVQGPDLRAVLQRAGLRDPLPEALGLKEVAWQGAKLLITLMAEKEFEACEIWMALAEAPVLWNALQAAGARPVGTDAFEMFRVAAGIPRYGVDVRSQDLPQETGQTRALSFTKGCYIGQEIVERIHSRGNVHRALIGFVVEGPPPAPGARVEADGKDVGEVTSAATVPFGGDFLGLALGYLRREAAKPGLTVQIDNVDGTVTNLPFQVIFAKEQTHAE